MSNRRSRQDAVRNAVALIVFALSTVTAAPAQADRGTLPGRADPAIVLGAGAFDIAVNGNTVRQNFDIAQAASGSLRGVKLTFDVSVNGPQLDISFVPVVSNPKVDAIRAYPIDAAGNPLPKQYDPGAVQQAWSDLQASGFRDAITAYQRMVRDVPTLGGLLSASGGRWYDGWPSLYKDYERQVVTALPAPPPDNVIARGTPTGALLTWRPYDGRADGIASYDVYRAPAGTSEFTKLNTGPVTSTDYHDVADGDYRYAVTAVTTGGVESPRSYDQAVQAGGADDRAPRLVLLSEPDQAVAGEQVPVAATVFDGRAADDLTATLHYRRIGAGEHWLTVPMTANVLGRANTFYADIPASAINADSVEYYVSASDGTSTGFAPPGAPDATNTVGVWPATGEQPGPAGAVTVRRNSGGPGEVVSWQPAGGPVHEYAIYRGAAPGFRPDASSYLTYVAAQQRSYLDVHCASTCYYQVLATTLDGRTGPDG